MKGDQKREEPPRQAARRITKTNDESKDTTRPVTVDRALVVGRRQRRPGRGAGKGDAAPTSPSGRTAAPSAKSVTVSRLCAACKAPLVGKRRQTKTCSSRCRQRLSRDRRGLRPKPIGIVLLRPRRRLA